MSLTVREISAAAHLAHLRARRAASFQQTPSWAGVKTDWRSQSVGWYDGQWLVGTALVLHRPVPGLPRWSLAYVPWGPVLDGEGWSGDISRWLDPLGAYLRAQGAFAIRLAPPVRTHTWSAARVKSGLADPGITRLDEMPADEVDPVGADVIRRLADAGWRPQSPEDGFGPGQPQYTFELPLRRTDGTSRSEADLLDGMNQLWRRNIRRAARDGVRVATSTRDADLRAFHDLYVETAERDGFRPRALAYFVTMLGELGAEDPQRIRLYLAHHDEDLVAAAIGVRVGTHAWYAYGASSGRKREVRGSNACQWAMIRDALAAGCDVYDLRGITPTLDTDDPHAGLIRFKAGTGGRAVRYVGEWDLPLRPAIYRAFDMSLRYRERRRRRGSYRAHIEKRIRPDNGVLT